MRGKSTNADRTVENRQKRTRSCASVKKRAANRHSSKDAQESGNSRCATMICDLVPVLQWSFNTVVLLIIEPLGSEFGGRNTWKSQTCFPHK